MMTGFGMGFAGIFGLIFTFMLFGGLILLVVWGAKSILGNNGSTQLSGNDRTPSSQDILEMRYARGEITREQFELMKQDLQ